MGVGKSKKLSYKFRNIRNTVFQLNGRRCRACPGHRRNPFRDRYRPVGRRCRQCDGFRSEYRNSDQS